MKRLDWSDDILVKCIHEGGPKRKEAMAQIYKNLVIRRRIENYVRYKGGSQQQAEDIFVESIILLDRSIRNDKFKGDAQLSTYLYAIAKNTWFNILRKEKKSLETVQIEGANENVSLVQNPELTFIDNELNNELNKVLALLSEKCQVILKLWSDSVKYDEIARQLGVENNGTLRKQKLVCLRKLKDYLMAHPELIPQYYYGGSE